MRTTDRVSAPSNEHISSPFQHHETPSNTQMSTPPLSLQVDKEFDRILRGGVFHPRPLRPAPHQSRPSTRSLSSSQQTQQKQGVGRATSPGFTDADFANRNVSSTANGTAVRTLIGSRGNIDNRTGTTLCVQLYININAIAPQRLMSDSLVPNCLCELRR